MKQLIGSDIGSYAFNATARTITFSGVTLTLEQLLLVTDVTAGVTVYQFNSSSLGGSLAGNVLTLDFNTSAFSNTDTLQIFVDLPETPATFVDTGNSLSAVTLTVDVPVTGTVIPTSGYTSFSIGVGGTFTSGPYSLEIAVICYADDGVTVLSLQPFEATLSTGGFSLEGQNISTFSGALVGSFYNVEYNGVGTVTGPVTTQVVLSNATPPASFQSTVTKGSLETQFLAVGGYTSGGAPLSFLVDAENNLLVTGEFGVFQEPETQTQDLTWDNTTAVDTPLDFEGSSIALSITVTGTITQGVISFLSDDPTVFTTIPIIAHLQGQPYTDITSVNLTTLTPGTEYIYLLDTGGSPFSCAALTTVILGSGSVELFSNVTLQTSSQNTAVGQTDATQLHATVVNAGTFATQVTNFPTTQPVSGTVAVSNLPATQPVSGSVSVSNLPGTQPVSGSVSVTNFPTSTTVTGTVAVQDSAAETSLSTLAGTVLSGVVQVNDLNNKTTTVEINGTLAINATFIGNWHDTQADGNTFAEITFLTSAGGFSSNAMNIDQSDDQTNILSTPFTPVAATLGSLSTPITHRYWRARFINGTIAQSPMLITSTASNVSSQVTVSGAAGLPAAQNPSGYFVGTLSNGNTFSDGTGTSFMVAASSGSANVLPSMNCVSVGTSQVATTAAVMQRSPSTFRGASGGSSAGAFPVWVPSIVTKKARLMKYAIEIAEDATLGAPIYVSFAYGLPLSVAATILTPPNLFYQHRVSIPGTAPVPSTTLVTNGLLYEADKDLGNGFISALAGQTLYCGIQVPQPTTAITTAAFTLPSSTQWEAGIVAFKTPGGLGNFKLLQASGSAASTTSAALVPQSAGTQAGNSVFVIVRTSNATTGVPTTTVTDTQSNTYTPLAQITNTSDTANGSSLQLFYCLNCVGGASNTVTATTSVHQSLACHLVYLEYSPLSAIGGTSQVSATGNSTTPTPGSFTPGETGDLVIMYAGTATTSQATIGAASSPFFMRGRAGGATGPTIFVADNWGNGSLTTGLVNVIVEGTEE